MSSTSPRAYLVEPKIRLTELTGAIESKFPVQRKARCTIEKIILDSFDWRLFARGYCLSACSDNGRITLGFESPGLRLHCRLPHAELPGFEWDIPAGRLRKLVASAINVRRLLPQVRVELEIETICLLNRDRKTVARLHIQQGTAVGVDNDTRTPLPLMVLLAPVRGYEQSLHETAAVIEHDIGLTPMAEAPFATAIRAAGVDPGGYVAKKTLMLAADTRADVATAAICRQALATMRANEDGVLRNLDSEFLHDFRVAVRRTRSALGLLKGVFPAEVRAHFKSEFKWLGNITGAVRDLDVYLLKIPVYRADLPESMGHDLDPLSIYLHQHHRSAHRRLVGQLKSKRYEELLSAWEAFLAREPRDNATAPLAGRVVVDVASKRIWKAYRRVYKCGRAITLESAAEDLHRLRINCKMLRYLLEFFSSVYPPNEVTRLIQALKQLQDNLGDVNDLQVQQIRLREFAHEMCNEGLASADTLSAMERLVEHLAQRQIDERLRFSQCWRKFATAANHGRFRRLFKNANPTVH